jgi:hypothetical protein
VRNVWCHEGLNGPFCDITFEHDANLRYTVIRVDSIPPLWAGEHAYVGLRHTGDPLDEFLWAQRIQ